MVPEPGIFFARPLLSRGECQMLRILERLLLLTGLVCLIVYGFFKVQAVWRQWQLEESFEELVQQPKIPVPRRLPAPSLTEGDIVGRLKIPRLNLSVMVMEGVASGTLRQGAGHIPGTAFPGETGNAGIAAHRDTHFRPLAKIRKDDKIVFETVRGRSTYRVKSTSIVKPADVHVLRPRGEDMMTLITCYPFYYIGPAPKRFVVHATRE
jgi:sortase A